MQKLSWAAQLWAENLHANTEFDLVFAQTNSSEVLKSYFCTEF